MMWQWPDDMTYELNMHMEDLSTYQQSWTVPAKDFKSYCQLNDRADKDGTKHHATHDILRLKEKTAGCGKDNIWSEK